MTFFDKCFYFVKISDEERGICLDTTENICFLLWSSCTFKHVRSVLLYIFVKFYTNRIGVFPPFFSLFFHGSHCILTSDLESDAEEDFVFLLDVILVFDSFGQVTTMYMIIMTTWKVIILLMVRMLLFHFYLS